MNIKNLCFVSVSVLNEIGAAVATTATRIVEIPMYDRRDSSGSETEMKPEVDSPRNTIVRITEC